MGILRWLETRALILVVLGLTGYAILQPFIWKHYVHRLPPAGTADLSTLITVVLTVMSIALALFGVVAYRLIDDASRARLEKDAARLAVDLEAQGAQANAQILRLVGFQAWMQCDQIWRTAGDTPYAASIAKDDLFFKDALENAISLTTLALAELAKASVADATKVRNFRRAIEGQLAFNLATRRKPADEEQATKLVEAYASESDAGYHDLETFAWVFLRFYTPTTNQAAAARKALEAALVKGPTEWGAKIRTRYRGAFTEPDGSLDPALQKIVGT